MLTAMKAVMSHVLEEVDVEEDEDGLRVVGRPASEGDELPQQQQQAQMPPDHLHDDHLNDGLQGQLRERDDDADAGADGRQRLRGQPQDEVQPWNGLHTATLREVNLDSPPRPAHLEYSLDSVNLDDDDNDDYCDAQGVGPGTEVLAEALLHRDANESSGETRQAESAGLLAGLRARAQLTTALNSPLRSALGKTFTHLSKIREFTRTPSKAVPLEQRLVRALAEGLQDVDHLELRDLDALLRRRWDELANEGSVLKLIDVSEASASAGLDVASLAHAANSEDPQLLAQTDKLVQAAWSARKVSDAGFSRSPRLTADLRDQPVAINSDPELEQKADQASPPQQGREPGTGSAGGFFSKAFGLQPLSQEETSGLLRLDEREAELEQREAQVEDREIQLDYRSQDVQRETSALEDLRRQISARESAVAVTEQDLQKRQAVLERAQSDLAARSKSLERQLEDLQQREHAAVSKAEALDAREAAAKEEQVSALASAELEARVEALRQALETKEARVKALEKACSEHVAALQAADKVAHECAALKARQVDPQALQALDALVKQLDAQVDDRARVAWAVAAAKGAEASTHGPKSVAFLQQGIIAAMQVELETLRSSQTRAETPDQQDETLSDVAERVRRWLEASAQGPTPSDQPAAGSPQEECGVLLEACLRAATKPVQVGAPAHVQDRLLSALAQEKGAQTVHEGVRRDAFLRVEQLMGFIEKVARTEVDHLGRFEALRTDYLKLAAAFLRLQAGAETEHRQDAPCPEQIERPEGGQEHGVPPPAEPQGPIADEGDADSGALHLVDQRLAASVVAKCIERNCRHDCLEIVARVLAFDAEERRRVGLDQEQGFWNSLLPAWSRSQARAQALDMENQSFSDLLSDFVQDEIS